MSKWGRIVKIRIVGTDGDLCYRDITMPDRREDCPLAPEEYEAQVMRVKFEGKMLSDGWNKKQFFCGKCGTGDRRCNMMICGGKPSCPTERKWRRYRRTGSWEPQTSWQAKADRRDHKIRDKNLPYFFRYNLQQAAVLAKDIPRFGLDWNALIAGTVNE